MPKRVNQQSQCWRGLHQNTRARSPWVSRGVHLALTQDTPPPNFGQSALKHHPQSSPCPISAKLERKGLESSRR